MKIRQIALLFCCVLVCSGCGSKGSYSFFATRYPVDAEEFERGYEAGIAFAKTEGRFSSSPKDVPSSMQKIISTETDSFQKGFLAGYRDRKVRNGRLYNTVFWGTWAVLMTSLTVANLYED